jgi:hypothetical protein
MHGGALKDEQHSFSTVSKSGQKKVRRFLALMHFMAQYGYSALHNKPESTCAGFLFVPICSVPK